MYNLLSPTINLDFDESLGYIKHVNLIFFGPGMLLY